jgi:nitronate monooxygenase
MTIAPRPRDPAALRQRVLAFQDRFGLRLPLWMAPMAGVTGPALPQAVARAGAMPALGALMLEPAQIDAWVRDFRAAVDAPLHLNLWMPDPPPRRDAALEARWRDWLAAHGPAVPAQAADARPVDVDAQCAAVLAARPAVASTIMGLLPSPWRARWQAAGIAWFATVTTVAEARAAQAAGADGLIVQGAEAGGHRGRFSAADARDDAVGLFALLPQVADAVDLPLVATGGIADARGVAAALLLGADAAQIGTGLLRCEEAGIPPAWSRALAGAAPEDTVLTRAFSGRWGRSLRTAYVEATRAPGAPEPADYPVQRGLTGPMRAAAQAEGRLDGLQAWAGQAGALADGGPAGPWLARLAADAGGLLGLSDGLARRG